MKPLYRSISQLSAKQQAQVPNFVGKLTVRHHSYIYGVIERQWKCPNGEEFVEVNPCETKNKDFLHRGLALDEHGQPITYFRPSIYQVIKDIRNNKYAFITPRMRGEKLFNYVIAVQRGKIKKESWEPQPEIEYLSDRPASEIVWTSDFY